MRLFDLISPKQLQDALLEELDTKRCDELKPLIVAADQILRRGDRFLAPRDAMLILIEAIDAAIEKANNARRPA